MVALSENNRIIANQFGLYEQQARAGSPRVDAVEIGAIVGFGLHLYHTLRRLDQHWSGAVQEQRMPATIEDARQLGDLYQRWLNTSHFVLPALRKAKEAGEDVVGSTEFSDACQDVAALLSIPLEPLYSPVTKTKTASEVRDALQRHVRAIGILQLHDE